MTCNPSARNRIAPLWRCPYCLFESVLAGERKEIYLLLPDLKVHLLEWHGFDWAAAVGANKKSWCPEQDRTLRERRAQGQSMRCIAAEMGRSENSVYARWGQIKDEEVAD